MKTLILACILNGSALNVVVGQNEDPSAEKLEPKVVDDGKRKDSTAFLGDDLLKHLNEPRLDKGAGKDGLIRITVFRSFHSPVVFIWYPPAGSKKESVIHVKRLKQTINGEGVASYHGLDIDKRVTLKPAQTTNLKKMLEPVEYHRLPQRCWQPDMLDGSTWIYEVVSDDHSLVFVRRTPVQFGDVIEHVDISKQRLLAEMNLTRFAVMLWMLTDIDDTDIY